MASKELSIVLWVQIGAAFEHEENRDLCGGLPFRLRLQRLQEVGRALRVRSGAEDRAFVGLQHLQPMIDIAGVVVAKFRRQFKAGAKESCAKLGIGFLHRITVVTVVAKTPPAEVASRIQPPVANSISITPALLAGDGSNAGLGSAATATGLNGAGIGRWFTELLPPTKQLAAMICCGAGRLWKQSRPAPWPR